MEGVKGSKEAVARIWFDNDTYKSVAVHPHTRVADVIEKLDCMVNKHHSGESDAVRAHEVVPTRLMFVHNLRESLTRALAPEEMLLSLCDDVNGPDSTAKFLLTNSKPPRVDVMVHVSVPLLPGQNARDLTEAVRRAMEKVDVSRYNLLEAEGEKTRFVDAGEQPLHLVAAWKREYTASQANNNGLMSGAASEEEGEQEAGAGAGVNVPVVRKRFEMKRAVRAHSETITVNLCIPDEYARDTSRTKIVLPIEPGVTTVADVFQRICVKCGVTTTHRGLFAVFARAPGAGFTEMKNTLFASEARARTAGVVGSGLYLMRIDAAQGVSPPTRLTKSGFLRKIGGLRRSWLTRWFVLMGSRLYYFSTPQDGNPVGCILLTGASIRPTPDAAQPNSFEITTADGSIFGCSASSQTDFDSWLTVLASCATLLPAASEPLTPGVLLTEPGSSVASTGGSVVMGGMASRSNRQGSHYTPDTPSNKELQASLESLSISPSPRILANMGNPARGVTSPRTVGDHGIGHQEELMAPPRTPTVDDFEWLSVLGKGSAGKVVLAKLKNMSLLSGSPNVPESGLFAVKIIRKADVLATNRLQALRNEWLVLQRAKCPFMVQFFCSFQSAQHLYIVLEYIPGGELFFHLERLGKFTEHGARFYTAQLARAIAYLHSNGVMFRDLKPENVLLTSRGDVKLVDFGLCRLEIDSNASTLCGTPEYLAPEVLQSCGSAGAAPKDCGYGPEVDWWCLGVVLYELLTGTHPFYSPDRRIMFSAIVSADPLFPNYLSPAAVDILRRLLSRNPQARLGAGGAMEVMTHPFFASVDWASLHTMPPPIVPKLKSPDDVRNFPPEFTSALPEPSPPVVAIGEHLQGHFVGFSFVGSTTLN